MSAHALWSRLSFHQWTQAAVASSTSSVLGNPPLLVVCDLARFEIQTHFNSTVPRVYRFTLDDLAADPGEPLRRCSSVHSGSQRWQLPQERLG
jgi:hypothetical protein